MFSPTLRLRTIPLFIFVVLVLAAGVSTASAQSFSTPTDYALGDNPNSGAAADFNGDGKLDLAVANFLGGPTSAGTMSILIGNGNGTFQPAVTTAVQNPFHIVATDLNADGKQDLIAASATADRVSVMLGNGDGTFQSPVTYTVGSAPRTLAIADFNGDGKPDVAVTNSGSDSVTVSLLIGNGNGTFQA